MGEKVKLLRSTNCLSQNSYKDVKYSTRNIVNNIPITTSDVYAIYQYNHLVSYIMPDHWSIYLKLI